MTFYKIILSIAYQLFVVSFAHYSIWNFIHGIKSNKDNENRTSTLLANIAIALLLIFIVFSNTILVMQEFELLIFGFYEYLEIVYGITIIAIMAASVFAITGDFIISEKFERQKLAFRLNTLVIIITGIIFVLATIISNRANGTNYIDIANHYYLPVYTLLIPVLVFIDAIINKHFRLAIKWNAILIMIGAFFSICDLVFLRGIPIQLSILFYAFYSLHSFRKITEGTFGIKSDHLTCLSEKEFSNKYKLTAREIEVIKLTCMGMTNNQIADQLFISTYTVKNHLQRIFAKMEIDNRHKLMRLTSQVKFE